MNNELHIGVWGEDNFKNYTPAIASKNNIKLLILGSADSSAIIQNSLSISGIDLLFLEWPIQANNSDFIRLETLINQLQIESIKLNLSTGPRLTTLQLFQWSAKQNYDSYLIDDDDQQHWLFPENKASTSVPDLASLKSYFRVHQIKLLKHGLDMPITTSLRSLVQDWGMGTESHYLFRSLNWLASSTKLSFNTINEPVYSVNLEEDWQAHKLQPLLVNLQEQSMIKCTGRKVTFANEASRFFCNGGWLELYVYEQIRALKLTLPEVQDVRLGVEVEYTEGVKNELDVVFLAGNRLHLIEVKTSYLADKTGLANNVIYKLEALSNALGQEVKGMVVSLFDMPKGTHSRAGIYDLKIADGKQLSQLQYHLKQWINE